MVPVADTEKLAEFPSQTIWLLGSVTINGAEDFPQPGGIRAVIAEVDKAPVVVNALPSISTPVIKFIAPLLQTIVPLKIE